MRGERGDEVSRRGRNGAGPAGNEGARDTTVRAGKWSRRRFLGAAGAAAGLASLGLAASVVGARGNGAPETAEGVSAPPTGVPGRRAFTYKGKRVEVVEDGGAEFADVTIDGEPVRARRVGGMYRAPGFTFVPAHSPDDLAKVIIDYRLALAADAAGDPVTPVTVPDGAHRATGGH